MCDDFENIVTLYSPIEPISLPFASCDCALNVLLCVMGTLPFVATISVPVFPKSVSPAILYTTELLSFVNCTLYALAPPTTPVNVKESVANTLPAVPPSFNSTVQVEVVPGST